MNSNITILDWDTNFFKKKIGRIENSIYNQHDLASINRALTKQEVDLAYYSSTNPLSNELHDTDSYSINFVDRKTTYNKVINKNASFNEAISEYQCDHPAQKLIDLSVESGTYSRFKVDTKIDNSKFEELYSLWIINSVNRQLAKSVLVYYIDEIIAGFVTLGEKNEKADIGIIAVDAQFRGKGIGKSLMLSAERRFADNTANTEIQVVTQGENIPACKLYESCGYEVNKVEYFYHLWKKDNEDTVTALLHHKST